MNARDEQLLDLIEAEFVDHAEILGDLELIEEDETALLESDDLRDLDDIRYAELIQSVRLNVHHLLWQQYHGALNVTRLIRAFRDDPVVKAHFSSIDVIEYRNATTALVFRDIADEAAESILNVHGALGELDVRRMEDYHEVQTIVTNFVDELSRRHGITDIDGSPLTDVPPDAKTLEPEEEARVLAAVEATVVDISSIAAEFYAEPEGPGEDEDDEVTDQFYHPVQQELMRMFDRMSGGTITLKRFVELVNGEEAGRRLGLIENSGERAVCVSSLYSRIALEACMMCDAFTDAIGVQHESSSLGTVLFYVEKLKARHDVA